MNHDQRKRGERLRDPNVLLYKAVIGGATALIERHDCHLTGDLAE